MAQAIQLAPPIPKHILKNTAGLFSYTRVKGPAPPVKRTGHITCEYLPIVQDFDQGGIGDCGGNAGAYWGTCLYFAAHPDQVPQQKITATPSSVHPYNNACTMQYLAFDSDHVRSVQWTYKVAQFLGGIPFNQEGVSMPDVAKGMVQYGSVPWKYCWTPMEADCAPNFYPSTDVVQTDQLPPSLQAIAIQHKIKAFAVLTDWDQILAALADNPKAMGIFATNLYADYMDLDADGFWKVHPSESPVGSHAQWICAVDFDYNGGEGYFQDKNSWGLAVQYPKISKAYYEECGGPVYVALGMDNSDDGTQYYTKLVPVCTDNTNAAVDCTFTIDGQAATSFQVETGIPHTIVATPKAQIYQQASIPQMVTPTGTTMNVEFKFNKKVIPPPSPPGPVPGPTPGNLEAWIKKMLHDLLHNMGLIKLTDAKRKKLMATIRVYQKSDDSIYAMITFADGSVEEYDGE